MILATQDKPFLPENWTEKLSLVKELGFDAYEIDGAALVNKLDEIKEAVEKTGLPVCSVCGGYKGWIGDFDEHKRQQAVKDISEILKAASEIGAKGIVVPAAWGMFSLRLPPMVPPRSSDEDRKALLDSLKQLEEAAAATNTYVFLEPLNRYEDHMINTVDIARSIIVEGGFKHVKITADFFHMNIEEKSIPATIKEHQDLIGHIHLADSHRYQPGDGHMDFVSGFKVLKEINFQGCMAFECRVLGDNPLEAYRESVKYIRQCIADAR